MKYLVYTAIGSAICEDFSMLERCIEKLISMKFDIRGIVCYEE